MSPLAMGTSINRVQVGINTNATQEKMHKYDLPAAKNLMSAKKYKKQLIDGPEEIEKNQLKLNDVLVVVCEKY